MTRMKLTNIRSIVWLVVLLTYTTTILLSLTCDSIDGRLYLGFNVTVTENEIRIRKLFNNWNTLSICRSVGGLVGWILLGFVSSEPKSAP